MAIDVHIIEMEKEGMRVSCFQNCYCSISHSSIRRCIQCIICIFSEDVVIDRSPMANRVGVEFGVSRFQSLHEGWKSVEITSRKIVAGHSMRI